MSSTERIPFRLTRRNKAIGGHAGGHRGGWPMIVDHLATASTGDGIIVDDFVETTFRHQHKAWQGWVRRLRGLPTPSIKPTPIYRDPWVGMFHLPPNYPKWFAKNGDPETIFRHPNFRKSRSTLVGAVAFSKYHADALRKRFDIPVCALLHPTDTPSRTFDLDTTLAASEINLVQIGWYLRNYRGIYQVAAPYGFRKMHLRQRSGPVDAARHRTDRYAPTRNRPDVGDVEQVEFLPNDAYDDLLSTSVIFLELFDASANNTVVEALTRRTPLVVNRHPAVVEYLGADYPLFYDDVADVPALLTRDAVAAAHRHLSDIDRTPFAVDHFVSEVVTFLASIS